MALEAADKLASSQSGDSSADKYNESYITGVLNKLVKDYDLRSSIFGTFYRVGFELHELTAAEK